MGPARPQRIANRMSAPKRTPLPFLQREFRTAISRFINAPICFRHARSCYDLDTMKTPSLNTPRMPSEYYRAQAARVRDLAHDATTDAIREHLVEVALQYERLADGAEAGRSDPE